MNTNTRKLVKTALAIAWIITIIWATVSVTKSMYSNSSGLDSLDVKIYPRGVKLTVGETENFQAFIYNGTSPYDCKWYSNGTYYDSGEIIEFSFTEPCNYTILSVTVTDINNAIGTDSVFVYDPTEITIEEGSFQTEASYIVYKSGTTTYMLNGTTGQIDDYSTNSSQIISWCIGNLTSGGKIFIKAGTYYINTVIKFQGNNNIDIVGEGFSTIIYNNITNWMQMFWLQAPSIYTGISFRNFRVDGTSDSGMGIKVETKAYDILIDHVKIDIIGDADAAIMINGIVSNIIIQNSIFKNINYPAIKIGENVKSLLLSNNHIENCTDGIFVSSVNCKNFTIRNNVFKDTEYGVRLYQATGINIRNNHFFNSSIYQIKIGSLVENTIIKDNTFFVSSNIIQNLGTNTIWGDGNIIDGKPCENSGTTTDCVNGTYVSHGLAGTPNQTLLTISGSNSINATCFLMQPSIIATNSTHFQIGFHFYWNATAIYPATTVEQRDVYWYTEYKP